MKVVVKIPKKKTVSVFITTDYIRLDAALKLAGAVSTGGQAKAVIQDGLVKVNGEQCLQRGKKLHEHDKFSFNKL